MRRLHRDRQVAALLRLWNAPHSSVEARTCRALFRDMAEMVEFFTLAFPHAGSVADATAHGYIVEDGVERVHVVRVLEMLGGLEVSREFLHPAAYLADMQNRRTMADKGAATFAEDGHKQRAWDFFRAFKNVEPSSLRRTLRFTDWRNVEAAQWVMEAASLGLPDSYLGDLCVGPLLHGHGYNPWTPQQIVGMHAEGMSVEYLKRFWKRPTVLAEMWEHRIPLDYAIALDESTRTD